MLQPSDTSVVLTAVVPTIRMALVCIVFSEDSTENVMEAESQSMCFDSVLSPSLKVK